MSYQIGFDKGIYVNGTAVGVTGWDDTEGGDLPEVTSTNHNGLQALLAGIARGEGNTTFNFDSSHAPEALGIVFGAYLTIVITTGGTPLSRGVRVAKVNRKSTVNGVVSINFDYKTSVT